MFEGARINGRLWLEKAERGFAGAGRIALLEAVARHGSIAAAARALGMSYKAAWEAVDAMNSLAEHPLVVRTTGGRRGGGTRLTGAGAALVQQFRRMQLDHEAMLGRLNAGTDSVTERAPETPWSAAPNRFPATVAAVTGDEDLVEVELTLAAGARVVATLPGTAARALALAPGLRVEVRVAPSAVILAPGEPPLSTSARNRLCGHITRCVQGRVKAELRLAIDDGPPLDASLTAESVRRLGLREGVRACALVKASQLELAPLGRRLRRTGP